MGWSCLQKTDSGRDVHKRESLLNRINPSGNECVGARNGAVRSCQHSKTLTSGPGIQGAKPQASGDKDREDRKHRELEMTR